MRHSCDWRPARGASEEQTVGLSTATAATRAAATSVSAAARQPTEGGLRGQRADHSMAVGELLAKVKGPPG